MITNSASVNQQIKSKESQQISFQFTYEGLRSRRVDCVVLVERSADLRSSETQCFSLSLKAGKKISVLIQRPSDRENLAFPSWRRLRFYIIVEPSVDWIKSTHIL